MNELGRVLLIAILPGLGSLFGALFALWSRPPRWVAGVALHAAAGIAIGVVSLELMPRALTDGRIGYLATAFIGGAAASIILSQFVGRPRSMSSGAAMVVVAAAIDLGADGIMTGAGSSIAASLGLLLAGSQVVGNFPNGFATMANLDERAGRGRRALLLLAAPLVPVIGAAVGYLALRQAGTAIKAGVLAFMAGLLLLATVEDTVAQGDAPSPPRRYSSLAFAAGFAAMMLASVWA